MSDHALVRCSTFVAGAGLFQGRESGFAEKFFGCLVEGIGATGIAKDVPEHYPPATWTEQIRHPGQS